MRIDGPLPVSASVELGDGRIARVVKSHHASPAERWAMWKNLSQCVREYHQEEPQPLRKRLRMYLMFLSTVLRPDCKACWYVVE